ncbi:MAG: hypothetical protein QOG53_3455 [Frankiales bacterium]|nr:hypothetical protein [Frankiales bacterium]
MPLVDLIDETYVVAAPAVVAERLRDDALWQRHWPGLERVVFMDRGDNGTRWTVTGALVGTCEVWLEAFGDGTIVHYFLRADPTRRGSRTEPVTGRPRRMRQLALTTGREHAHRWKAMVNTLKDTLEAGRDVGAPREAISPNGSTRRADLPRNGP